MKKIGLNLGAGETKQLKDYVNQDIIKYKGIDVAFDLNRFPYPFKSNTFLDVNAEHIIEHLFDTLNVMKELHRVCKNGAVIKIKVPYYRHYNAYTDPTHCRYFCDNSFDYFTSAIPNNYCEITGEFKMIRKIKNKAGRLSGLLPDSILEILNMPFPIFYHELEIWLQVVK